jgi:hypothetical protein
MKDNDFYVGYQREAPAGLARFLRPAVIVLVGGACALSLLITSGQGQFVPSSFEFGIDRHFAGVVSLKPYPVLFDASGAHVLFGAGKHGFTTSAPDGASVSLRGSAVSLGTSRGIEVDPETFNVSAQSARLPEETYLGRTKMSGEIVDSKCYVGVMNPGRGKVHRDCAVRCISGGLPPTLLVRDESGTFGRFFYRA